MRLEAATDGLINKEAAAGVNGRFEPDTHGSVRADSHGSVDVDSHGSVGAWLPWEPGTHPDPSGLGNDELESGILDLSVVLSHTTCDLLILIGEHDARGTWALRGALSCAAWLADHCDIERCTAHNQVRVARAMREYPALYAAMAEGDVSYSKARMLTPLLTEEHAGELVHLAATTPTTDLAAALAAWSHRNESPDEIEARHQAERSVTWRTEPDGMVRITARLAPLDAAKVCAMIDRTVTTSTPESETPAPMGASQPVESSYPSLAQQRADALVALVTTGSSTGSSTGDAGSGPDASESSSVTAEVVVHVTEDGNALPDGTPVGDHAVARLIPEAHISLLLHDSQRQPIDASPRRRIPTRRQQRVIDARQTDCQWPGCHAKALLQYDHKVPFPLGGPTTIDNLQRLCGPHNRAKYAAEVARRSA